MPRRKHGSERIFPSGSTDEKLPEELLSQDLRDNFAMDIRQTEVTSLIAKY